jgi:hypothetical protein
MRTRTDTGPTALIVNPDGSALLVVLPADERETADAIHAIVGGDLEGIIGPDWCAYLDEDYLRHERPANSIADHLARQLGWIAHPADYLCGSVVFLGRRGSRETDVPMHVLAFAGVPIQDDRRAASDG